MIAGSGRGTSRLARTAVLLKEFERDASGIAPEVAQALLQIRGAAMIERPLLNYYSQAQRRGRGGASYAAVALGPRFPGPAKASAAENLALREAIIKDIGNIGGDDAAKALRRISTFEQSKSAEQMAPSIIAALESAKSPEGARLLCEYAGRGDAASVEAIDALGARRGSSPPAPS